jgi:uncharacterized integral membrane protein
VKLLRRKGFNPETRETFQPRLWFTVGVLVLIGAYIVAFIAENTKSVRVHFVFYTAHTSVIWVVLLAFAIGLVGGVLLSQLSRRRGRLKKSG